MIKPPESLYTMKRGPCSCAHALFVAGKSNVADVLSTVHPFADCWGIVSEHDEEALRPDKHDTWYVFNV